VIRHDVNPIPISVLNFLSDQIVEFIDVIGEMALWIVEFVFPNVVDIFGRSMRFDCVATQNRCLLVRPIPLVRGLSLDFLCC